MISELRKNSAQHWKKIVEKYGSNGKDTVLAKFYGNVDGKIELKSEEQVDKIIARIDGKKYTVTQLIIVQKKLEDMHSMVQII